MATLDISVMKNPEHEQTDEEHFYTGRWIEFYEWEDLFQNVLHAPVDLERLEGESRPDYLSRREKLFREALTNKGYEMLSRIWYIFRDTFFAPSEVNKLLGECLELQEKTQNPKALSALEKLISASQAALKVNSGIFLASD
jgi:hypothetical protein